MKQKIALVTGILGQDGTYLRRYLLNKNYLVLGIANKTKNCNPIIEKNISLIDCNITNYSEVKNLINTYKPDLVFNLAGYSNVFEPWKNTDKILQLTSNIPEYFLSAICDCSPNTHFCQASSCLVFGKTHFNIQNEKTPRAPLYPYGIAKNYIDELIKEYRTQCSLHFTSAIFYNHESPYRGNDFFSKKLINFAKSDSSAKTLQLNNLNVKKDIGFAGDYVEAMYKIATANVPDDYIVSTNSLVSLTEIIDYVCELSGKNLWNQILIDETKGNITSLRGDNAKIKMELNWQPNYDWKQTIKMIWENN
jgi:GDPmannose 4,6-dehydratase